MRESSWQRHEGHERVEAPNSLGTPGYYGIAHYDPVHSKLFDNRSPLDLTKLSKDDVQPPEDHPERLYTGGEAMTEVTVQVTLGGKDLGDGLLATAAEVIVWVDPSGIVRAFRIANTIYHAVFGSSERGAKELLAGQESPKRLEPDLAARSHNTVLLSEESMWDPCKAAQEALRQHIAYLDAAKKKREKKRSGPDDGDLRD
jgi:hypothetical protein